jgi:CRP-like cAMP-binding protein
MDFLGDIDPSTEVGGDKLLKSCSHAENLLDRPARTWARSGAELRQRPQLSCRHCPVRDLAPCGALPRDDGAAILETFRSPLRRVPAGGAIFEQGEPSDRSFTVVSGWAALCQLSSDGRPAILNFALPGDILSFERTSKVATRSAIAVGDATVCSISRTRQERLEREYPDFDLRHKESAGRDLSMAYENLARFAFGGAAQRVAHLLWTLACRSLRRRPQTSDRLWIPANQIQFALATGLTSVHVSRTLRRLREEGLMTFENHSLAILNPAEVERLAGGSPESLAGVI